LADVEDESLRPVWGHGACFPTLVPEQQVKAIQGLPLLRFILNNDSDQKIVLFLVSQSVTQMMKFH